MFGMLAVKKQKNNWLPAQILDYDASGRLVRQVPFMVGDRQTFGELHPIVAFGDRDYADLRVALPQSRLGACAEARTCRGEAAGNDTLKYCFETNLLVGQRAVRVFGRLAAQAVRAKSFRIAKMIAAAAPDATPSPVRISSVQRRDRQSPAKITATKITLTLERPDLLNNFKIGAALRTLAALEPLISQAYAQAAAMVAANSTKLAAAAEKQLVRAEQEAACLADFLTAAGCDISASLALDAIAALRGDASWRDLCARLTGDDQLNLPEPLLKLVKR